MRRRLGIVALALVPLAGAAGCGGGGDSAQEVLSDTADNLGKVESGQLDLRVTLGPPGEKGRKATLGFALAGPFSLEDREKPVAKLEYTQIAGERQGGATFVSTEGRAFVETGGKAYELPGDRVPQLGKAAGKGALGTLEIDQWLKDPRVQDGPERDGEATQRVTAGLDVAEALRDLAGAAEQAGAGGSIPRIDDEAAGSLEKAVKKADVEVLTGKDDRLLREIRFSVDFGLDVPESLRAQLGSLVGGRLAFRLAIAKPNEPVKVDAPHNALPASALPTG